MSRFHRWDTGTVDVYPVFGPPLTVLLQRMLLPNLGPMYALSMRLWKRDYSWIFDWSISFCKRTKWKPWRPHRRRDEYEWEDGSCHVAVMYRWLWLTVETYRKFPPRKRSRFRTPAVGSA